MIFEVCALVHSSQPHGDCSVSRQNFCSEISTAIASYLVSTTSKTMHKSVICTTEGRADRNDRDSCEKHLEARQKPGRPHEAAHAHCVLPKKPMTASVVPLQASGGYNILYRSFTLAARRERDSSSAMAVSEDIRKLAEVASLLYVSRIC